MNRWVKVDIDALQKYHSPSLPDLEKIKSALINILMMSII